MKFFAALFLALVAAACAFQMPSMARSSSALNSRFDNQEWGVPQMLEIFNEWNPDSPRGPDNFNPFERDAVGNQCDPNGFFPGDTTYRDPIRPDMNFARMQEENA
eukprot:CAMPEP_0194576512 /NCGR_PEP_ID=MMETSP0292-20121207/11612_1 /TAXON_ID=39354 /ORGANISM="Heterosigma akashiwo, Strain CCMP2393" /LENGTH=104 /DNA_ID=CAMNT_0039428605 /DNA_START=58 /DNA_END=369 /DNA_ORIENTATION=+